MGVARLIEAYQDLQNTNDVWSRQVTKQLKCIQEMQRIQESYQMQVQAEEQQR